MAVADDVDSGKLTGDSIANAGTRPPTMPHADSKTTNVYLAQYRDLSRQCQRVTVAKNSIKTWMGIEKSPGTLAYAIAAMQQNIGITAIKFISSRQAIVRFFQMRVGQHRDNHEASLRAIG
jgi:hypothetical protein